MQIRVQGRRVQLIRTHYIKAKKRTEGKVFASFDRYITDMSRVDNSIIQQLEKEEVDKLKLWLSERENKHNVDSAKNYLLNVDYSIRQAIESLSVEEALNDLSTDKADKIYNEMALLAKSLRKAGFKKPVKAKTTVKTTDDQVDIGDLADDKPATINES